MIWPVLQRKRKASVSADSLPVMTITPHSQITVSCVWANMEMTLEREEIHQVTKPYEATFYKAHTPQKVNSKREAVAEDLKKTIALK